MRNLIETTRGDVTKYGFRIGRTQTRCFPKRADSMSADCYARIESCPQGFLAVMSGRYARRELYRGPSLASARKAYRAVNLADEHVAAARAHFAARPVPAPLQALRRAVNRALAEGQAPIVEIPAK